MRFGEQSPPGQQASPRSPQWQTPATHADPSSQVIPLQHGSPAPPQRQVPLAHARFAVHTFPPQHGYPRSPHGTHNDDEQTAPTRQTPSQQGCPGVPHAGAASVVVTGISTMTHRPVSSHVAPRASQSDCSEHEGPMPAAVHSSVAAGSAQRRVRKTRSVLVVEGTNRVRTMRRRWMPLDTASTTTLNAASWRCPGLGRMPNEML